MMVWRVGRKLGRTLYLDDECVGMVDSPELAEEIVEAMEHLRLMRVTYERSLSSGPPEPSRPLSSSLEKAARRLVDVWEAGVKTSILEENEARDAFIGAVKALP